MDTLNRLEDIESETVNAIESVGELMGMIGQELKQKDSQPNIVDCLTYVLDKISEIGEEVQEIIEGLPDKTT
jgi:hypothetical protein